MALRHYVAFFFTILFAAVTFVLGNVRVARISYRTEEVFRAGAIGAFLLCDWLLPIGLNALWSSLRR